MAVTDAAIDKIKQMILSGELAPGDRLPKEADLAERLGLSRNSLREAVRALALINVLDVRQGDGTYVTSLEPRLLLDTMSFVLDLHRDDTVIQFFEVRRILEPAATAMADRADDRRRRSRSCGRSWSRCPPPPRSRSSSPTTWSSTTGSRGGRATACSARSSRACPGPTTRARIWRGLTQEGAMDKTREQHTAIYEAIATRQPDVARSWATVHIAGVESWLRKVLP